MPTNHHHLTINVFVPLSELLASFLNIYDDKVVFGDFNLEASHPFMLSFMNNEKFH